jgi:predicted MPP superfamily phosphohydrolase
MKLEAKKLFLVLILFSLNSIGVSVLAQPLVDKAAYRFFIVSDIGQNGYYKQKEVANTLGNLAQSIRPKFIIASGDTFHYNGVRSTSDPLWSSNFESIYTNPWLLVDWFPILGNHEYRGNTQAVIDYSRISRRWNMPARYYTFAVKIDSVNSLRFVMLDTPPFMSEYKKQPDQYPDILKQNTKQQLQWLDSVLLASPEKWKIVIGHHPVYSTDSLRGKNTELFDQLDPVLTKHKVDFYFSGHIHIAQHIQKNNINYVVSPSGSLGVNTGTFPGAKFVSHSEGFTICTVKKDYFEFIFVDENGKELYRYKKSK